MWLWSQADAAFTCGISYEALNNAKSQTKRFIVVLNDNEVVDREECRRDRFLF
jgi:deoxyxylulose-5-phosphate synthase